MPFGVTVELLRDVLRAVGTTLNAETVRNHLQRVATRMEGALGEERTSWIEDCPPDPARLSLPEGPVVVGIDGGYVRARERGRAHRDTNFEVVVGQSIAEDRASRYFGLVQSFDDKPKRRLHEVLREQGLQMNQDITFLTDGGDTVRNLAADMSPCAEHVLDWLSLPKRDAWQLQPADGVVHRTRRARDAVSGDEVGLARAVRGHRGAAQGRPSRGDHAQCGDSAQPPAACRHAHGGSAWGGANLLDRGLHLTMRLTVLGQYAKGLAHHDDEEAHAIERELKRIKGYLWNGNHRDREALACIDGLVDDLEGLSTAYAGIKAFRKGADEFRTYVRRNAGTIPNYAERHRYGERVSTPFAESTVNTVVGKRFAKRQQMRWSRRGAHLMLQTRTRVLDGTLRAKFQSWYPGLFHMQTPDRSEHDFAA